MIRRASLWLAIGHAVAVPGCTLVVDRPRDGGADEVLPIGTATVSSTENNCCVVWDHAIEPAEEPMILVVAIAVSRAGSGRTCRALYRDQELEFFRTDGHPDGSGGPRTELFLFRDVTAGPGTVDVILPDGDSTGVAGAVALSGVAATSLVGLGGADDSDVVELDTSSSGRYVVGVVGTHIATTSEEIPAEPDTQLWRLPAGSGDDLLSAAGVGLAADETLAIPLASGQLWAASALGFGSIE